MASSPSLSSLSSRGSSLVGELDDVLIGESLEEGTIDKRKYPNSRPITKRGWSRSVFSIVLLLCVAFVAVFPILFAFILVDDRLPQVSTTRRAQASNEDYVVDPNQHIFDVLIIGAGWSGLAAANHLKEKGVENFEILEARDTVGGRSRTVYPFTDNLAVEMGSAWTYEDTEVHEMMLEQEIPHGQIHYHRDKTFGLYQESAPTGEVTGNGRKQLMEELWWEDFIPFSEEQKGMLRESGTDKPYQQVLDEFLEENNYLEENDKARQFLQAMVHAQIEIEYAAPLAEVSTSLVGTSVNGCLFCGAHHYVPVQDGGFDKIMAPLVDAVTPEVQLNHVVSKIECGNSRQPARVTYATRNGKTNHTKVAKRVLVTVPLGVLKANAIEFVPSLPASKQNAIDFVGFGVLNKCVLYWDNKDKDQLRKWWPKGKELLTLMTDQDNTTGTWTSIFNDKELGDGGHYVLSAWTGGEAALEIEYQSDEEIVGQVLKNLRTMLGDDVPAPTKFVISRWGQDEFARGSYSFATVGREGLLDSARRELGARVGTRLYWAGEATHEEWTGTTVGAYKSGKRAADDILLSLGHGLLQKEDADVA